MDELDRRIIALLQMDGRASNARIALELGVSEGTIRRRARPYLILARRRLWLLDSSAIDLSAPTGYPSVVSSIWAMAQT